MPIEQFATYGKKDTHEQVIETTAQNFEIVQVLLNGGLDSLNIRRLIADKIFAGTLDAGKVTISASDGSFSYTIDKNGIVANNGSVDTLKFDLATGLLTIVSAIIKSQSGYPQVAFNVNNNIMQAFSDANNHIDITPTIGGSPGMAWYVDTILTAYFIATTGGPILQALEGSLNLNSTNVNVNINAGVDVNLNPSGKLNINGSMGSSGSFQYVRDVVAGVPSYGSVTVTKGLITNFT